MSEGTPRLELSLSKRRDTWRVGAAIARHLSVGSLVFLEGELGAGKSELARSILRARGLPEEVPIPSPTFSILVEYRELAPPIFHGDLYRLHRAAELDELGLERCLAEGVLLLEWADPLAHALPAPTWIVRLQYAETADGSGKGDEDDDDDDDYGDTPRAITIEGPSALLLAEELAEQPA